MNRSFLLFISALFLLGCKTSKESLTANSNQANIALSSFQLDSLYSYRTLVKAYGREMSGIFYFKKTSNENYKVVFSNEAGFQMMALDFEKGEMTSHKVFKKLDKKIVLNALAKGIRLIFYETLCDNFNYIEGNPSILWYTKGKSGIRIQTDSIAHTKIIESTHKGKPDVIAKFDTDGFPEPTTIDVEYKHLDISFHLEALKK